MPREVYVEHDVRPWGEYFVLADEPTFKIKRITVQPGERLSLQLHRERSEHWFIVAGEGIVTLDGDDQTVNVGESVDIPAGTTHRVSNVGLVPLMFVEIQSGTYFGEDDIVRIDDDYGRVPAHDSAP